MKIPNSLEEIIQDFHGRRLGILMALTEESDDLFKKCDPDKDNLCLYGDPDGTWVVDSPSEEVPPEMPEPVAGINFARDSMPRQEWLSLVALHSDAWLLSVAFFFGARLDNQGRSKLFSRINEIHSLHDHLHTRRAAPHKTQQKSQKTTNRGQTKSAGKDQRHQPQVPEAPQNGRPLSNSDISQHLRGQQAELFWPDDNVWYKVKIISVNVKNKTAKILYEVDFSQEELDLNDIIRQGHMMLLG